MQACVDNGLHMNSGKDWTRSLLAVYASKSRKGQMSHLWQTHTNTTCEDGASILLRQIRATGSLWGSQTKELKRGGAKKESGESSEFVLLSTFLPWKESENCCCCCLFNCSPVSDEELQKLQKTTQLLFNFRIGKTIDVANWASIEMRHHDTLQCWLN